MSLWARIKPYNPQNRCLRRRMVIGGKCFHGGSGAPGDIPTWYRITEEIKSVLEQYHQMDDDMFSPLVFDFAYSDAEKDAINNREAQYRMLNLGLIPQVALHQTRGREEDVSAKPRGRATLAELADRVPAQSAVQARLYETHDPALLQRQAAPRALPVQPQPQLQQPAAQGNDAADPRYEALRGLAPAESNEEPQAAVGVGHEDITLEDDDAGDRPLVSGAQLRQMNAEARANIPRMDVVPDQPEPPTKAAKLEALTRKQEQEQEQGSKADDQLAAPAPLPLQALPKSESPMPSPFGIPAPAQTRQEPQEQTRPTRRKRR